jgi:mRNA interferase RelE/StbE
VNPRRYSVEFQRAAKKELDQLDGSIRARIVRKIATLADDPRPPGVTRLTGTDNLWRIRIGDYRVVYTIQDDRLVVVIVRVAGRGKVYRDL